MKESITVAELETMLARGDDLSVLDVRLVVDRAPVEHPIPGAEWRDPERVQAWGGELEHGRPVVVFCVHGLRVSRGVRQQLFEKGIDAAILEGGIDAWQQHVRATTTT